MFFDTKRVRSILDKLNITSNQAWFCLIIMEQNYKYKLEWYEDYVKRHGGFYAEEVEDLEKKGYIENFSDSKVAKTVEKYITKKGVVIREKLINVSVIELFMVTPKFRELVYVDAEEAGKELLSVYPTWITIKGKRQNIKIISDRDAFFEYYYSVIGGDILKHKFIVEMFSKYKDFVNRGKANGMGIIKALESELWNDIQELVQLEDDDKDLMNNL